MTERCCRERVNQADYSRAQDGTIRALVRCPEGGADRLLPLTFNVDRAATGDEERPHVVAMRPVARGGRTRRGCIGMGTHGGDLAS